MHYIGQYKKEILKTGININWSEKWQLQAPKQKDIKDFKMCIKNEFWPRVHMFQPHPLLKSKKKCVLSWGGNKTHFSIRADILRFTRLIRSAIDYVDDWLCMAVDHTGWAAGQGLITKTI